MDTLDTTNLLFRNKNILDNSNSLPKTKSKKANNDLIVKVVKVRDTSQIPQYKHPGDGACDLCADFPEDHWTLTPYSTVLIPTGIKIQMPKGYCAYVLPRSGISLKSPLRIANSPGLIDNGFTGEIQLIVDNLGAGVATIKRGERLAQLMFVEAKQATFKEVKAIDKTVRASNGFGSTGT